MHKRDFKRLTKKKNKKKKTLKNQLNPVGAAVAKRPGRNWAKRDSTTHHPPPTTCFEGGKFENFFSKKIEKVYIPQCTK